MEQKWPQTLWIVRHGQSAGNVARDAAELGGLAMIDIADRDVDVPLSPLGEAQAEALATGSATLPPEQRPEVVLSSPYVRARQTADRVLDALHRDDATRDEETIACVPTSACARRNSASSTASRRSASAHKYPELAEQRAHVGKFYFRPPGGESWCDVILRLRSVLDMLTREYGGERVLVVAHQVIVNCLRYLLERIDEEQILGDRPPRRRAELRRHVVRFDPDAGRHGKLVLQLVNFVAPLREAGAPVTAEPDVPVAAKS